MGNKIEHKWRKIITIATLIALVLLIYFSRHQIVDTFTNLGKVQAGFLIFLVLFKILAFHGYTRMFQGIFRILKKDIEYKTMYKINLELNFVNNVFPSGGVTGFSYFGIKMRSHGVSGGKSALVQILRFALLFISFQALIFIGLIILSVAGKTSNLTILVSSSLATLLLAGTGATAYIIGSKRRIDTFFTFVTKFFNKIIQIVRPKHPETINIAAAQGMFLDLHENYLVLKKDFKSLKKPLLYALIANVAEIVALYSVYLAFDSPVNLGGIIIAYAVANFAGLISVLPGGIGIYEGLMVAVLASAGVSPAVSIPVTIMYRILTMSLQLPPGYYFYHQTINSSPLLKK